LNTLSEHSILISPVEELAPELLNPVVKDIQKIFGYRTSIKSLLQDVEFALDTGRSQYHSTLILEKLAGLAPAGVVKILAITRVDLFIPILTHVYGEAQLGGKTCIISTHRLNEGLAMSSVESFSRRVVKEAIHELGHTFDLRHCQDHACIMHYCRSIKDVDRKSDQLCRYCRILLADELKRMSGISAT
jgi:archaemetzincin